jgi:hypothetical protein
MERMLHGIRCALASVIAMVSCSHCVQTGNKVTGDTRVAARNIAAGTITVSSATSTGAVMRGAMGWLYGLGENGEVNDGMITGLAHPGYFGQKPSGGTLHPDGDALNTAVQVKRTGGRGVYICMQDYYSSFPYPNIGIADYLDVVRKEANAVLANANRSFFLYSIFNEPDWIWYSGKVSQMCADWKACYEAIRAIDSTATIIGPGYSKWVEADYRTFFSYCKANSCLPDMTTWHELDGSLFDGWYTHYSQYRKIESDLGIDPRPIIIDEYGRSGGVDIPVPGNLIQYIARFENSKVYGCMAFWTGIGTLNDLVANDNTNQDLRASCLNTPTGGWYLYQWYGQMEGDTVRVTLPSQNGSLQALASKSGDSVTVLFGGSRNRTDVFDVTVTVTGMSGTSASYSVLETADTGRNAASTPTTKMSDTATVSGGTMSVTVTGCSASSAFRLKIN